MLIATIDHVVTVDTMVVHLAGALGRPVSLLLDTVDDWRWLLNRLDTPWYDTMRLYRQRRPGKWESVINDLIAAL